MEQRHELLVMKAPMYPSLELHCYNWTCPPFLTQSCYLPGGSLCLLFVFDLLLLVVVRHILLFLDEYFCCGGAHPT